MFSKDSQLCCQIMNYIFDISEIRIWLLFCIREEAKPGKWVSPFWTHAPACRASSEASRGYCWCIILHPLVWAFKLLGKYSLLVATNWNRNL